MGFAVAALVFALGWFALAWLLRDWWRMKR